MEFLRPTNFGPAQQIAERILQLQQQSAQSIGGGIQSATNSIVGGLEKKYALDKAAADKKEGRDYAKQEDMITVDENLSNTLKSIGLDAPVGSVFNKEIFKTAITAKGAQVRTEQTIGARADEGQKGRDFKAAEDQKKLDLEAAEKAAALKTRLENGASKAEIVVNKAKQALAKVGPFTTGLGSYLASVRGSEAANLAEDLKTIEANLSFEELAAMREASKTGGALGAIAVRELDLLGAAVASLSTSQNDTQLRQNLNEVIDKYAKVSAKFQRIAKEGAKAQPNKQERREQRVAELERSGKTVDQIADAIVEEGL